MPSLPETEAATTASPYRSSFLHDLKTFSTEWIRLNGFDILVLLVIGGLSLAIYHAPISVVRTFPITFNGSGDIIYPQWAYPHRGWIVPAWLSGVLSILGPIVVYLLAQIRIKSAWDASNAIMGTIWAVALGSLFQVTMKELVGGFRPYFLDVCQPDTSLAPTHNKTGLNAVGFKQIMYTTEICTQPNAALLKVAITSFPSGHSTAAFAGFVFLFLWLNAKLKVWADHKPAFWKLTLTMVPLLVAVMIACSLTIDAAHNWYDILAGSVIGTVTAVASYRSMYAAVLDWRFNHLPLQEREAFEYVSEEGANIATQTFTRSVGWGARGSWFEEQVGDGQRGEGASSAFWAHRPGALRRRETGDVAVEGRPKRRVGEGVL